jgi:hypothetical protein
VPRGHERGSGPLASAPRRGRLARLHDGP